MACFALATSVSARVRVGRPQPPPLLPPTRRLSARSSIQPAAPPARTAAVPPGSVPAPQPKGDRLGLTPAGPGTSTGPAGPARAQAQAPAADGVRLLAYLLVRELGPRLEAAVKADGGHASSAEVQELRARLEAAEAGLRELKAAASSPSAAQSTQRGAAVSFKRMGSSAHARYGRQLSARTTSSGALLAPPAALGPAASSRAGGCPLLQTAARTGQAEVVRALLAAGVAPGLRDRDGQTPLVLAAAAGHLGAAVALLTAGANPNAASGGADGRTPLAAAAAGGHVGVVRALLAAGASPRGATASGHTALHLACAGGHSEVARALLKAGADPHAPSRDGRTPLGLVQSGSRLEQALALHYFG